MQTMRGHNMKQQWLLALLLLMVVAVLVPGINYATPNQSASENFTNTTNISEIVENNTNSSTIQNTTTAVVNDTGTNQQENQTSETSNNTQNSSSEDSNQTETIQNYNAAASDGTYNNVHAIYLNVDDVNNVDVDKLIAAGITDVFVKSNRVTYPTYQTILTKIIDKLNNTDIRIHAWITCFVDANGNWVDPANSDYRDALVKAIADISKNYDIDGIHLDYVRYPGTAYNHTGATAAITSFVKEVYETVKSINAKIAVSAAVMPECSVNAYYYGQSYTAMSQYLTFIVPMIYEGNYNEDNNWITSVTSYIVNHSSVPVVVALQTYGSDDDLKCLSVEEIDADIKSALSGCASGFALFRYGWVDSNWYTTTSSDTSSNPTTKPTSTTSFTIAQIVKTASEVRGYVEAYKTLPVLISVGGVYVNQSQFLYLLSVATLQIDDGGSGLIGLLDVTALTGGSESMSAGTLSSSAYLKLASEIKSFIGGTSTSPSLCKTSLGYLSYQSVIYMYSRILDQYRNDGDLPAWVAVKSWSSSNLPIADIGNLDSFTVGEIVKTASDVRGYVEAYKTLPVLISVGGVYVNQSQFLYLLSVATLQIDDGGSGLIGLLDVTALTGGSESMSAGTLSSSAYLELAGQLVSFIEGTSTSPSLCKTSLGYLSYQSVIYMYSRILDQYRTKGELPGTVTVLAWSSSNIPIKDNVNSFTVGEIVKTASAVKGYVEVYKTLPTLISVAGVYVNQAQFLYLLTTCVSQLNDGITTSIGLISADVAKNPSETMNSGNLTKSEYLGLANRIISFMDSNGAAPNYGSTTLGTIRFESLIYLYGKVADFYGTNNYLPNYSVMKSWSSVTSSNTSTSTETIPSSLQVYLQATANCESNDASIIALAQSITSGATTSYEKAVLIYNWVRDNLAYSFYYDTQKGAVGTLQSRSANCCDHAHLVVALSRAAGLPARYVHGYCYFTSSGAWYGHVWAEIYADGRWITADATSSRNSLGIIKNWDTSSWTCKGIYAELPF
jgi:transglutaminase-like putative cysteine protease